MLFACVAQKELDALLSNSLATKMLLFKIIVFFLNMLFNFCHMFW